MQPIDAGLQGGGAVIEHTAAAQPSGSGSADAIAPAWSPAMVALQPFVDCPETQSISDLAELAELLTRELVLFSALAGRNTQHALRETSPVRSDATQSELHDRFIQELDEWSTGDNTL